MNYKNIPDIKTEPNYLGGELYENCQKKAEKTAMAYLDNDGMRHAFFDLPDDVISKMRMYIICGDYNKAMAAACKSFAENAECHVEGIAAKLYVDYSESDF